MIMRERLNEVLKKARKYILNGLAVLLAIVAAPAGIVTLVMVTLIDILKEIADEE